MRRAATFVSKSSPSATASMARALLDHGAHVNALNHLGETPLHVAAENGEQDVLKSILLARKADVDPCLFLPARFRDS